MEEEEEEEEVEDGNVDSKRTDQRVCLEDARGLERSLFLDGEPDPESSQAPINCFKASKQCRKFDTNG